MFPNSSHDCENRLFAIFLDLPGFSSQKEENKKLFEQFSNVVIVRANFQNKRFKFRPVGTNVCLLLKVKKYFKIPKR